MDYIFFNREYTCPVCRTVFKSFAIRSSHTYVEKKESDLHIIYRGPSPLHYSVIVCPCCGYAASANSFADELAPRITEQLALALSQLKSDEDLSYLTGERDATAALKSFQLAVRTAQLKKVPKGDLAGLLLASAWIAREIGNQEMEHSYMLEALKYYIEAYNNGSGNIGNMDDMQAGYLIGELFRRTGNYNEAVNWFGKIIYNQNTRKNPQIEKMAREQWSLCREEAKQQPASYGKTPKVSANETTVLPESNSKQLTSPKAVSKGEKTKRQRTTVKMPASLYSNQVDWLRKISNSGYESTRHLLTREQVLRAIVDAIMEVSGDNIPAGFSDEFELTETFIRLLRGE